MLIAMRLSGRLLLAATVVALSLSACQSPPPVAETKPKRKSFEESNAWQPATSTAAAPAAASSGSANVDAQARQAQQSWEQARQATSDAERQRAAGEALKQTRAMAEQPSSGNQ